MDVQRRKQLKSIGDYTDAEGRLLAERGASDISGWTFDMRACPYRDGRHGQAMNADGLRQIRAHWAAVLPAIRVLERDNRELFGDTVDPLTRVRRLTRVLGSLPEFLVLFHGTRSGDIPVLAAVLYKIARGMNSVINRLTFDETRAARDAVTIGAETLYAYIERHDLLVGRDEVCAGPKNQIVDVLAALCGPDTPTGEAAAPRACPLGGFLSEAHRRLSVRYGVGLSDHLLIRRSFADTFAVLATARTAVEPDPRRTRMQLAGILARPCVVTPDLEPPMLDSVMAEFRRVLSAFVTAAAAPVPDDLIRRIDALWLRVMAGRQGAIADMAAALGVQPSAAIQISDIPERADLASVLTAPVE
ncbi:MAG: hypothetical protein P1U88_21770 [Thalassobaculaceae bacterium]|nr:hypothetical protein [Thalassobaculaceae bacterium]